jgi:hypothetical protein
VEGRRAVTAYEWPPTDGLPSLAETSVAHARLDQPVHEIQAMIDKGLRERLY